ncbi:MAG: hypothetical protein AB8G99_18390 [Planctomycetaceae bacterium]
MYVGHVKDPAAVNTLLAEALCISLDNAISGCATEITVTFLDDGSVSVCDDGLGLSVTKTDSGLTPIEILLTQLHACRDAKTRVNESLCGVGIVVTNCLSSSLVVETVQDGWLWRQDYAKDLPVSRIRKVEPSAGQMQRITFLPDPEIFGSNCLSPDYFFEWFVSKQFELESAVANMVSGGQTRQLFPVRSKPS